MAVPRTDAHEVLKPLVGLVMVVVGRIFS